MADFVFKPPILSPRTTTEGRSRITHYYDIHQGEDHVGHLVLTEHKGNPRRLDVENIEVNGGPNSMGPSATRAILKQVKVNHPNAEYIVGKWISGAREAAGDNSGPKVIQKLR